MAVGVCLRLGECIGFSMLKTDTTWSSLAIRVLVLVVDRDGVDLGVGLGVGLLGVVVNG